jgi:hypothetical protein
MVGFANAIVALPPERVDCGTLQSLRYIACDPIPQIPIRPPKIGQVMSRRGNRFNPLADCFQTRDVIPSAVTGFVVVMHYEYLLVAHEQRQIEAQLHPNCCDRKIPISQDVCPVF